MSEKNWVLKQGFAKILQLKADLQPNHRCAFRIPINSIEELEPKQDKFVEAFTAITLAAGGHHPDQHKTKDWRTRVAEFCEEHDLKWSEPYDKFMILELRAKRERVAGRKTNEKPLELEVQKALKTLVGIPGASPHGVGKAYSWFNHAWENREPKWVRIEIPIDYSRDVFLTRKYPESQVIVEDWSIPTLETYQEIKLERHDFVLEGKRVGLWFALEGEAVGPYGSLLEQTLYWDVY